MSRDDTYLLDMLIAARHAAKFARSTSKDEFQSSRLHQDAIAHELEIIGEAARHVSDETRKKHTRIEWQKITGMRNRIIHDYRHLDQEIVWRVVTTEVPDLIEYLQRVVPLEEKEP